MLTPTEIKHLIKSIKDSHLHGTGIVKYGTRKWFNPLRYFKGRVYMKRVSLKEVFK
jgi:hypothetical protein